MEGGRRGVPGIEDVGESTASSVLRLGPMSVETRSSTSRCATDEVVVCFSVLACAETKRERHDVQAILRLCARAPAASSADSPA